MLLIYGDLTQSPYYPGRLNDASLGLKWTLGSAGALLLLSMLTYPLAYDHMAFLLGGEKILKDGAIPYRDIIDTKPPLIFYLYSLAVAVFGMNEWGIRVIDIMWQAVTSWVLYKLIQQQTGKAWLGVVSAFLYVFQYVVQGYWMTAQAESFAILPALGILWLALTLGRRPTWRSAVVAGSLLTFIFFLKFTLIAFLAGVVVYVLLETREISGRKRMGFLVGAMLTLFLFSGLYILYLYFYGALDRFLEALAWVSQYAAMEPLFDRTTITLRFQQVLADRFRSIFSLTFVLLGTSAFVRVIRARISSHDPERPITSLLILLLFCLFFTVVGLAYERKLFAYQFLRAFVFFAPFVALGLAALLELGEEVYSRLRRTQTLRRTVYFAFLLAFAGIALFYSPAVYLISQPLNWTMIRLRGEDPHAAIQNMLPYYHALDHKQVGEYLKQRMEPQDQMFFWGYSVAVYYFAERRPTTMLMTNTPFITEWTKPEWKLELLQHFTRSKPRFVVVETGDDQSFIAGTELHSDEALRVRLPNLYASIMQGYVIIDTLGHYQILERR